MQFFRSLFLTLCPLGVASTDNANFGDAITAALFGGKLPIHMDPHM
jgi:hypothetical protein